MTDPYEILGVPQGASDDEIKTAYRELAKKYHPDNYGDNPLTDLAQEKMAEINQAYDSIMSMRRGGADYAAIRRYIDTGHLDEADRLLEQAPANNRPGEWFYLKGMSCYRRGWMEQAVKHFDRAAALDPTNEEYRNAKSQMNWQRGGNYGSPGSSGPYRNTSSGGCGGCSGCDICTGLCCADTCCECMGGDLCRCC